MPNLSPEDRHAVDAILMNGLLYNPTTTTPMAADSDDLGGRTKQVAKILHLLDAMPTEDPPDDLLRQTLARIAAVGPGPDNPSIGDTPDQPVA